MLQINTLTSMVLNQMVLLNKLHLRLPQPYRYKNSNLKDGLYGSIESYQGKDFIVELVLTLPNHSRKQFIREKRFKYFGEALSYLQEMIEELNKIWMD